MSYDNLQSQFWSPGCNYANCLIDKYSLKKNLSLLAATLHILIFCSKLDQFFRNFQFGKSISLSIFSLILDNQSWVVVINLKKIADDLIYLYISIINIVILAFDFFNYNIPNFPVLDVTYTSLVRTYASNFLLIPSYFKIEILVIRTLKWPMLNKGLITNQLLLFLFKWKSRWRDNNINYCCWLWLVSLILFEEFQRSSSH